MGLTEDWGGTSGTSTEKSVQDLVRDTCRAYEHGVHDTPRNQIAHAAHVHGWDWQGWGHVVTISRGPTSIRIIFSRAGNIVRAFNHGEKYARMKIGRDKWIKVVDQIIRDLSAGPPAGSAALLRR